MLVRVVPFVKLEVGMSNPFKNPRVGGSEKFLISWVGGLEIVPIPEVAFLQ